MVNAFADKARKDMIDVIEGKIKNDGVRFGCSHDEWTSNVKVARLLNVCLLERGTKSLSLGLEKVIGALPAEAHKELLRKKLADVCKRGVALAIDSIWQAHK